MSSPAPVAPRRRFRLLADWPIATKLGAGFGLVTFLLIANALAFFVIQRNQDEQREWTRHSYEVMEALRDLEVQTLNQQTGLRGYMITADSMFLKPYTDGVEGYRRALVRLRGLVVDNPAQLSQLDRIDALMTVWTEDVAKPAVAGVEAGGLDIVALTRKGKNYRDELRAIIAETQGTERMLLAQRSGSLRDDVELAAAADPAAAVAGGC